MINEHLYQYPDIKWAYVFPHGSLRPCSVIIGYSPNSLLKGETVRIGWNILVRVFSYEKKSVSVGGRLEIQVVRRRIEDEAEKLLRNHVHLTILLQ